MKSLAEAALLNNKKVSEEAEDENAKEVIMRKQTELILKHI